MFIFGRVLIGTRCKDTHLLNYFAFCVGFYYNCSLFYFTFCEVCYFYIAITIKIGAIMNKKNMIIALIEHYCGGNKGNFAKKMGLTPQAISTWLARGTFDIEIIFANCEDISPKWLLTGEGPMLETDRAGEKGTSTKGTPKKEQKSDPKLDAVARPAKEPGEGIPLLPISAKAGALSVDISVLEYECERYVIPAFKGAEFLMPITGDSMTPHFNSGDIVACKRLSLDGVFFQWNKVYVVDSAQGAIIKRIMPGSDSTHITLVSDNDMYPPFELPVSEIHAVALVIGVIRLE